MKPVKPSQLELDQVDSPKTREELLLQTMPHIDPNASAFKAALAKVDQIAMEERAREKLDEPDFDWAKDDAVVFKEQLATAVYFNRFDDLVIRQQSPWSDDGSDVYVCIAKPFQQVFLDKLCDALGIPSERGR
jgi:hypothetical protein